MTAATLGLDWANAWIDLAAAALHEHREELIELDRVIGDADHGENMDRGFAHIPPQRGGDVAAVLKTVATTLISTVGGASGPLVGTAFLRAAKAAPAGELDSAAVARILAAALDGITARGKAHEGEKTMVDAWAPAVVAATQAADAGEPPAAVLRAAADAADAGARATIPLVATKGRASYLGERAVGHQDPGATSSALLLDAAARAAEGEV